MPPGTGRRASAAPPPWPGASRIPRRRRTGARLRQGHELQLCTQWPGCCRPSSDRAEADASMSRICGMQPTLAPKASPSSSSRSTTATSRLFFNTQARRCRSSSGSAREPEVAARSLSLQIMEGDLADRIRISPATTHMSRSPAIPAGTSPMSARSTTRSCSTCSTNSAMPAGSAANTGPRADAGGTRLGEALGHSGEEGTERCA